MAARVGNSPPLQLKRERIKPRSAVRSQGLTRINPERFEIVCDDEDDRELVTKVVLVLRLT
jgi:hypothetical protein